MNRTLRILAASETDAIESKSLTHRAMEAVMANIDLQVLQQNLAQLTKEMGELLANISTSAGFGLKQMSVGVEFAAKGGITLRGPLTASGKAAVVLTFEGV